MDILLDILIVAYASTGIVAILGYWPTIKDLFQRKRSANTVSYLIWTLTGIVSFLYALFILNDLLVRIITGLNFVSCLVILILSIKLKKCKRK